MEYLDKLIAAVEVGEWEHDAAVKWLWRKDGKLYGWARGSFKGSLNSAKALHKALLDSGFHAEIQACCTRPRVRVVRGDEIHDGHEQESEACSWLIATLKAYRSDLSKGAAQ